MNLLCSGRAFEGCDEIARERTGLIRMVLGAYGVHEGDRPRQAHTVEEECGIGQKLTHAQYGSVRGAMSATSLDDCDE